MNNYKKLKIKNRILSVDENIIPIENIKNISTHVEDKNNNKFSWIDNTAIRFSNIKNPMHRYFAVIEHLKYENIKLSTENMYNMMNPVLEEEHITIFGIPIVRNVSIMAEYFLGFLGILVFFSTIYFSVEIFLSLFGFKGFVPNDYQMFFLILPIIVVIFLSLFFKIRFFLNQTFGQPEIEITLKIETYDKKFIIKSTNLKIQEIEDIINKCFHEKSTIEVDFDLSKTEIYQSGYIINDKLILDEKEISIDIIDIITLGVEDKINSLTRFFLNDVRLDNRSYGFFFLILFFSLSIICFFIEYTITFFGIEGIIPNNQNQGFFFLALVIITIFFYFKKVLDAGYGISELEYTIIIRTLYGESLFIKSRNRGMIDKILNNEYVINHLKKQIDTV